MRIIGPRVAAASATLLTLLGLTATSALGDRWVETVYAEPATYYVPSSYVTTSRVVPTSASYVVPTGYSYVYPTSTSYVVPTSATYVVPTTTSYVVPASYSTTAYSYLPGYTYSPVSYTYYRRPGLLRRLVNRPVYETVRSYSYDVVPTAYYQPTTITYDAGVVTTGLSYASLCQESPVAFNPPPPTNGNGGSPEKPITSSPTNGDEPTYKGTGAASKAEMKDTSKESPPAGPVPEKPERNGPDGVLDPPAGEPKDPGAINRSSLKPGTTEMRPRIGVSSANMLRGEIVKAGTNLPASQLQIVFVDQRGTYPDKIRTTDDKGSFEVFLPNGGWMIKVVDPNAAAGVKPLEYGPITSANGTYLDDTDRAIYRLKLNH